MLIVSIMMMMNNSRGKRGLLNTFFGALEAKQMMQ
jgi:hypothetical protein